MSIGIRDRAVDLDVSLPRLLFRGGLVVTIGFFSMLWLFPILYGMGASLFTDVIGEPTFVGLDNYVAVVSAPLFGTALWNSLVYTVSTTLLSLGFGLAFALAINQGLRGATIYRTLIIFPYLIPIVVTAFLWEFLLDQTNGVVNKFLVALGVIEEPIAFFSTTEWAMPAVVVMSVWVFAAFAFFILLAQLQSIDDALYERATVEGASTFQQFRDITYPQIRSTILLILFIRGIWLFNTFDIVWVATNGGPLEATTTIPIYIYELIFTEFSFGAGAALGTLLFFLLAIGAAVYFKLLDPQGVAG